MSTFDNAVSINPYFTIPEGKMEECKGFLARFCELVKTNEEKCLFFNFTLKGNEMCCREAYTDAEAVLAHLENCGPALGEMLESDTAELLRIEVHGPADELEKLKEAFTPFNPDYYVSECGIGN